MKNSRYTQINRKRPPPTFSDLPPPPNSFVAFDEIATGDVEKLLDDSSTKQCELDTAPVWLLKTLLSVFAPILTLLINVSLSKSTFPDKHKRAIIRPRLKNLDLTNLILQTIVQFQICHLFLSLLNVLSISSSQTLLKHTTCPP